MSPDDHTTQFQVWIDRLRDDDPAAREQLLRATGERLRHLARKMLRDFPTVRWLEDTDDVLQDGMLRV